MGLGLEKADLDEVTRCCADDRFVSCAGIVSALYFPETVAELKELCARFVAQDRDPAPLRPVVRRLSQMLRGRYDRQERGDLLIAAFPDWVSWRPYTAAEIEAIRTAPAWLNFSMDRAEAAAKAKAVPVVEVSLPELDALTWIASEGEVVFANTWTQKRLAEKGLIDQWGYGKGQKFKWTHSRLSERGARFLEARRKGK